MISLLHPSRSRPKQGVETAISWIANAGTKVEHIFSLDVADPHNNSYKQIDKMLLNNNQCVVEAANKAAQAATGDIMIYLSDDFESFPNWAIQLEEICKRYSGEFLIKVHDGLQRFDNDVLTIPIMSRDLYKRLGYFFHPAYRSMWVDVDLYHVCHNLGVIKFHPEITFQHNHYCNGKAVKDETYRRSDLNFETGREIHKQRQRQGYP